MGDDKEGRERRKDVRATPTESVLLVGEDVFGAVLDLSMGGVAFEMIDDDSENPESTEVEILLGDRGQAIEGLRVIGVSDWVVEDSSPNPKRMRRRGLRFGELTSEQRAELGKLIKGFLQGKE